jgi:hypothetical protein
MAKVVQVRTGIEEKEVADERATTDAPGEALLFTSPAFTTLVSRWLDLADPQASASTSAMRQARRICGRWVMHRRSALRMDADRLAELIAVDAEVVRLLGLAGEDIIDTKSREYLYAALGSPGGDTWAASVIDVALGRCDAHAQDVAQVAAAAIRSGVAEHEG